MTPLTLALAAMVAFPDVSPDPATLKLTPADRQKAEALVRQLGAENYAERDAADRELRAMGRRALPVLSQASESALDPEVRVRSERLRTRAAADDFHARLATFLADTDGKYEHQLPGWSQFRDAVGSAKDGRELFAEIMRSEPNRDVIAGLAIGKDELIRRVLARRSELYALMYPTAVLVGGARRVTSERYDPTTTDAVTMIFADILTGDKDGARIVGARVATTSTLMTRSAIRSSLATATDDSALRALFVKWVDTRESPVSLYQAMNTATQLELKDVGLKTARKLLAAPVGTPPLYRAYAVTTLGKLGGKDELKTIVEYLADETVVRQAIGGQSEIQMRDVALAMALLLTNRHPYDYGYVGISELTINSFYYYNCRFEDDDARTKALTRWAELEPKLVPGKKSVPKKDD